MKLICFVCVCMCVVLCVALLSRGDPCIDVYYAVLRARGQCPMWDCWLSCLLIGLLSSLSSSSEALIELGLCGGYCFCSNISSRTYSYPSSSSTVTVSHFDSSLSLVKTTSGSWLSFSNLTYLFTGHMTCLCLGLWSACWEWKIFIVCHIAFINFTHTWDEKRNVSSSE